MHIPKIVDKPCRVGEGQANRRTAREQSIAVFFMRRQRSGKALLGCACVVPTRHQGDRTGLSFRLAVALIGCLILSANVRAQPVDEGVHVCRSVGELWDWSKRGTQRRVAFDLEAHLVFAGPSSGEVRVQHRGRVIALTAMAEISRQLSLIPVGTLLSLRGLADRDKDGGARIQLRGFANDLAELRLRPVLAATALGSDGSGNRCFAMARGQVREALVSQNRVHLVAGDKSHSFEVTQYGEKRPLRVAHLGQRWEFSGYLRPSVSSGLVRAMPEVVLMNGEQMRPRGGGAQAYRRASIGLQTPAADPQDLAGQLEAFEGVVVYSDRFRGVGVVSGRDRIWLRSLLAHRFAVGTRVRGVGSRLSRPGLDVLCFKAKFTEVVGHADLDAPEPAKFESIDALCATSVSPPLVRLKAAVDFCFFSDATMTLRLKANGEDVVVEVPVGEGASAPDFRFLAHGTEIEMEGFLIRMTKGDDPSGGSNSQGLRIHVASVDDIRVVSRPVAVPASRLFAGGAIALVGLVGGCFWIVRLRRRVKDIDRSLSEFDHHFQTAFDAMQCGVLIVDSQSRILKSNCRLSSFFGVEPMLGQRLERYLGRMNEAVEAPSTMSDLVDAASRSPGVGLSADLAMKDPRRTTRVFTCPIELDKESGRTRLWLFEDISEKRRLESSLLQSQKMEAVGRLSGGMAHDFNNLLMVIQSSLGMIREGSSGEPTGCAKTGLQAAELAVERATELTQQLLGFARLQRLEKRPIDAVSLLSNVGVLASRVVGSGQSLVVDRRYGSVVVDVDPGRIEQALLNLCINAIDVAPEEGGQISLSISSVMDPVCGSSARFSIADNGPGISIDDQRSIFDPFFTTKAQGKGTGLGLSIALGIVEQHGGRIDCQSTPGRGARFDVFLPVISDAVLALNGTPPLDCPGVGRIEGGVSANAEEAGDFSTVSVLVVEDEAEIRAASCRMLEGMGCQVESVENAVVAIQRIANQCPDLVLLDLMLPEMSGLEAYREIRSAWPGLPVLFCSGDSNAQVMIGESCGAVAPPLLPKPFTSEELNAAVRAVLEFPAPELVGATKNTA